jgi:hypothetical protein
VTSFCGHTLKIQFSVHLWLIWMIFGKGYITIANKSIIRRRCWKMLLTPLKEELSYACVNVVVT